jgi:FkbM family methyltransferase
MSRLRRIVKKVNRRNFRRAARALNIRHVRDVRKNRRLQRGSRSNVLYYYTSSFFPEILIHSAARQDQVPEPGFVTNFIGVKMRPRIMPSILRKLAGRIEGRPNPGNWHADIAEWGAAFHAVAQAGATFRMVELGCGWGCWMVNTGAYARQLGKKVELVGIEGDPDHLANAEMTLRDNDFSESEYRLVNGVAAPRPGVALFPVLDQPGEDWGGEAVFYPDDAERERLLATGRYRQLQCHPLSELAGGSILDLLHIDIQGAEVDFVRGNFDHIQRFVRRVLVGTHSRVIEGELTGHFLANGWSLEMDRPAVSEIVEGRPEIRMDGVQMWRNPAL